MAPASMERMEASAQPLRAPCAKRTTRAVHAGPLAGLIAQVLLLSALAGTVGLSATGWVIGLMCVATVNAALAHGLSRYRSEGLGAADWVTLARVPPRSGDIERSLAGVAHVDS